MGNLTFYRSRPTPCPYLPDRTEQQLFAELVGPDANESFQLLSKCGFRRTQNVIYRPACPACNACHPARVVLKEFQFDSKWRRILRINRDIKVKDVGLRVDDEQFRLFQSYLQLRHSDSEMLGMSHGKFAEMIVTSPVDTKIIEFRDPDKRLIACSLTDYLDNGMSAVYTAFDPALYRRSLGTYAVLWMIQQSLKLKLDYLYLGFWVQGSQKMSYKSRFHPLEIFGTKGWTRLISS